MPGSIDNPVEDLEINVRGSINLLEAARAAGIKRVVFSSSSSVVAGHPPPTHEGLVPRPVSPYGAAKSAVEAYLRAYTEAYAHGGRGAPVLERLRPVGRRTRRASSPRSSAHTWTAAR